jgi:hypothetical protein
LIGISDEFLKETWDKAETLMSTQGSVVEAPGFGGLFVQHSPTTTTAQHFEDLCKMDWVFTFLLTDACPRINGFIFSSFTIVCRVGSLLASPIFEFQNVVNTKFLCSFEILNLHGIV